MSIGSISLEFLQGGGVMWFTAQGHVAERMFTLLILLDVGYFGDYVPSCSRLLICVCMCPAHHTNLAWFGERNFMYENI